MARIFLATLLNAPQLSAVEKIRSSELLADELDINTLRWSSDAKLHLTWLFIGNMELETLPKFESAIEKFLADDRAKSSMPPQLILNQLEIWHVDGKPHHLVLTPSSVPQEYLDLAIRMRDALLPFVDPKYKQQSQRKPRPHLTIAHFKKPSESAPGYVLPPPQDNHPLQSGDHAAHQLFDREKSDFHIPVELDQLQIIESTNADGTNYYQTLKSFSIG